MLFELAQRGNLFTTWLALTVLTALLTLVMSGTLFRLDYWRPTFERWQFKSNPQFPKPEMVRREVLQMLKGLATATLCPALALHLVDSGWSQAYGGLGGLGWGYLVFSFFVVWIGSDLYEFAYHQLGHRYRFWWTQHKHHHVFFNPSPFAVIADDFADQLIRSMPLLLIPMLMPVNMDMMYLTYGAFFYGYGVYLHWGYELSWPNAHHPWINTAFQHYVHHAKSTLNKPMHTGFFFKLWDQLLGTTYDAPPETCLCASCCARRGERSREAFERVEKPDYSPLLRPSFWLGGPKRPAVEGATTEAPAPPA
jgi:sterol desaturase/sphingolipid hydroxylase (fatty acid hydroxylase superfamily)